MSLFSANKRRYFLLAAFMGLALGSVSWIWAEKHLGRIGDWHSERNVMEWGRDMSDGGGRWGISGNYSVYPGITHYPNGPIYILIPFMRHGWSVSELRYVPLTITSACFALYVAVLFFFCRSWLTRGWALLAALAILFQQGIFLWQGGLYDKGLLTAEQMLLVAAALVPNSIGLAYGLLGFISGWTGYDFFFIHLLTLLTVRLVVLSGDMTLGRAILRALTDGSAFLAGYGWAILVHLGQNALYFNSFTTAMRDLLGVAEVRSSASSSAVDPFWIVRRMYQIFANESKNPASSYSVSAEQLKIVMASGVGMMTYFLWSRRRSDRGGLAKAIVLPPTTIVLLSVSCVAWWLLMSAHSFNHFHLMPRMYMTPLIAIAALPVATGRGYLPLIETELAKQSLAKIGVRALPLLAVVTLFLIDRMFL